MSKRISNCARFAVTLIVLSGCSNESKTEYLAKESHLESIIFVGQENQNNQFIFNGDELIIIEDEFEVKPDTKPADAEGKEKSENVYHDIKIKTEGDKYIITGSNNFSLILQRVGKRIVADEDEQHYSTSKTLE